MRVMLNDLVILNIYYYIKQKKKKFESITIGFEEGLYKSCKYVFPDSILVGCYYHYKAVLVRHLKQLKIYKGENKKYLKILISILGMLPIHYNGDIEYLNKIILNLENDNRFKKCKIFFDYFRKE